MLEVLNEKTHYSMFAIWYKPKGMGNDREIFQFRLGNYSGKRFVYFTKKFHPESNPIWELKWVDTYFDFPPKSENGFIPLCRETSGSRWLKSLVLWNLANVFVYGQKQLNTIHSINGDIYTTEKGTKILIESDNKEILNLVVPTGYRGYSKFKILTPDIEVLKYNIYESPGGNLGISECGLLIVPKNINSLEVEFKKAGRRVNISHGIIKLDKVEENTWSITQFNYDEFMDLKNLDI